METSVMSLWTR